MSYLFRQLFRHYGFQLIYLVLQVLTLYLRIPCKIYIYRTIYLLLGEASTGLSRYQQAEEYLSLAKYAILKKPDCSYSLRSQLHRNFGRLFPFGSPNLTTQSYFSLGKYDEALEQLANDVYYSSLQFGPENTSTSGGNCKLHLLTQ